MQHARHVGGGDLPQVSILIRLRSRMQLDAHCRKAVIAPVSILIRLRSRMQPAQRLTTPDKIPHVFQSSSG